MKNHNLGPTVRMRGSFDKRRLEPSRGLKLPNLVLVSSIILIDVLFSLLLLVTTPVTATPTGIGSQQIRFDETHLGELQHDLFATSDHTPVLVKTSASRAANEGTSGRSAELTTSVSAESATTTPVHTQPLAEPQQPPSANQQINDKYFDFSFDKEYFEYEEKLFSPDFGNLKNVKGRLKANIEFWKHIGANPEILDTLTNGYKLPFLTVPEPSFSKNNKSAIDNIEFVESAVNELVKKHCVIETPFKPHTVNPLSVSINKHGKKRLILDLRQVNKCLWKDSFTFEDWKIGLEYFESGSFSFKFDLSQGYHHIDIFPPHQTFLGFSVNGKFYCFTVLPFGGSTSGFIFTKVLREMVKYWRSHGIKIVMFLDDGWGTSFSFESAQVDASLVRNSLLKAGFIINEEKSVWVPVQRLEWIGILWDSVQFSISIPDRRISDCIDCLTYVLENKNSFSARTLARCTGKIVSMKPVFGNLVRLMTRFMYMVIEGRKSWECPLIIHQDHPCFQEVHFWLNNIKKYNVRLLREYAPVATLVYSDASSIAAGAYVVNCKNSAFHSSWSSAEISQSSTFKEIRAINLALQAYAPLLSGKPVKWFSDSQSCVHIVQSGSTKLDLHSEAMGIFNICMKFNIDLRIQWIPRELNTVADDISKYRSTDEWEVSREFFEYLDALWGPHDIDRFATYKNRKTARYNSLFMDVESEAVDCFTEDWGGCNNWLVPPVCMVAKTILHVVYCRANATLVIPKWPSSSFWPLLFDRTGNMMRHAHDILEFEKGQNIFSCQNLSTSKCVLDSRRLKSKILAVKFRF